MNSLTDQQLLHDYTGRRSEPAFAELVRRHVDFVYSAALRMVRDAPLAEDVTQGVFVALAQNARPLVDHPALPGWLHCTAQNLAAKAVRSDVRRRAREQEAATMNELLSAEPEAVWEHIAPHLDAALGKLVEADRYALLLRFFKNHDFRMIGEAFGVSDDAAQKRVSRALERLRAEFHRRGVTTTAVALSAAVSANAVQAAPVGLAVTISTAAALAGTTLATTAIATATKTIVMTTLQKTVITVALTAAVGVGIYEAHQASTLRSQNQLFQQQQASLADQIQQLTKDRDETARRLAALRDDNERLKRDTAELPRLRGKVGLLQQALASRPQPQNATANWKPGTPRRLQEMSDVGQATPEAALQTTIWAALANPQRLLDLVHLPAPGSTDPERLERMRQGMVDLYTNVDWGLVKEITIERSDYSKHKHFDLVKDKFGNILQHAGEFDDYVEVYIDYPGHKQAAADRENLSEADQENPHPDPLPNHWSFTRVGDEWRRVIPGASPDNLTKPADVPSK